MTREEAIETLRANYPDKCYESLRNAVDIAIEALEAEPVKHAYVIVDEDGNTECSNCGSGECWGNYCSNCGARMDGGENDNTD